MESSLISSFDDLRLTAMNYSEYPFVAEKDASTGATFDEEFPQNPRVKQRRLNNHDWHKDWASKRRAADIERLDQEFMEKNDGNERPQWAMYCWLICGFRRDEANSGDINILNIKNPCDCYNFGPHARPHGKVVGNMGGLHGLFREGIEWDPGNFDLPEKGRIGDCELPEAWETIENMMAKLDVGNAILKSKRSELQMMMKLSRYRQRQRHIPDERNTDRRKTPTFARHERSGEARDFRLSKTLGRDWKYPLLSLMGLPAEVRLVILEHLFCTLEIDSWTPGHLGARNLLRARFGTWNAVSNPLAILLTCRELYFEGHKIFQEKTLFRSRLSTKDYRANNYENARRNVVLKGASLKRTKPQRMPPNVKRWRLQIIHPANRIPQFWCISWVASDYQYRMSELMQKQADDALRDGNTLRELTVDLEAGVGCSTVMSDFYIKKHAIDALLVFTGKVKIMRITGEIPDSLKDYAREMEILIQGYDDTPPPDPVEEVVEEVAEDEQDL